MIMTKYLITLLAAALVAGCGGGSGSDSGSGGNSSAAPGNSIPVPPAASTVTNPVTGQAALGTAVTVLHGIAHAGATVTAYAVQPDGSSGEALGAPVPTNAGGEFTLTFNVAPTSWVRVVARGGVVLRNIDYTTRHPVESMELVTPIVTTHFNHLEINPVTDLAARIMAFQAKTGATLADAFKTGMLRTLQLDSANVFLQDDVTVYMNMLKGSIKSDIKYYPAESPGMRDLLGGIERFGVMYDLPANEVWRVIAATGKNGYPLSNMDGASAITIGTWVGDTFDTTAPVALHDLLNNRTMDEVKVTDAATGARVAPRMSELVGRYLIMEFLVDYSCVTGFTGVLAARYPFYPLDSSGQVPASNCADVRRRTSEIQTRMSANISYRVLK